VAVRFMPRPLRQYPTFSLQSPMLSPAIISYPGAYVRSPPVLAGTVLHPVR
jgi:hypothetical protein